MGMLEYLFLSWGTGMFYKYDSFTLSDGSKKCQSLENEADMHFQMSAMKNACVDAIQGRDMCRLHK